MSEQSQFGRMSTPWQVPWKAGIIARYWTIAGATVDVSESALATDDEYSRCDVKCTGCPYEDSSRIADNAHRLAQAHSETCRALPRPEAQR
ncbi:hypothetical protein ABZ733_06945 [Streptomyces longwoodensis]|uniref:hypothetical protein n=1 Tax=Streptomyces longwoodensis TaxID=68231 RepID=UPI00340F5E2A